MSRWALFDVDGTLIPGKSMEERFLRYGIIHHIFPLTNLAKYLLTSLTAGQGFYAFKCNKTYLSGLSVSELRAHARDYFQRFILPAFAEKGMERVEGLRAEGYKIALMTGTPDYLARELKEVFAPDVLISTMLEIHNERYTGLIEGAHVYGEGKREILLEGHDKMEIDYEQSAVFANHHTDSHHMDLFGHPVAINPDPSLLRIAEERGWGVEQWQ